MSVISSSWAHGSRVKRAPDGPAHGRCLRLCAAAGCGYRNRYTRRAVWPKIAACSAALSCVVSCRYRLHTWP